MLGKHKNATEIYSEDDVDSLIKSQIIQDIINIDAELLEKADVSKGAEEAIARECQQFKMRLDYLETALIHGGPPDAFREGQRVLRPWTLAVTQVRQVAKEFGQTLTVSKNPAAPLWTSAAQRSGDTVDLRSSFRCGLGAYGTAEDIGFFDDCCSFDVPLLVQGFPTVLPNGDNSFTITKFCLDVDQATAMRKARKLRLDAEAAATKARLKEERERKRAEAKAAKEAKKKTKSRTPRGRKLKVEVAE